MTSMSILCTADIACDDDRRFFTVLFLVKTNTRLLSHGWDNQDGRVRAGRAFPSKPSLPLTAGFAMEL